MAFLVSDVLTRCRQACTDMPETVALALMNEVNSELCLALPLNVTTETITLVAGTREYALNEDTFKIWSAEYVTGANDSQRRALIETDLSALNAHYPGWRGASRGIPNQFYVNRSATDFLVGFLPNPVTSTTAGYPVGVLQVSRRPSTLTNVSSLPKGILKQEVYVMGVISKFAAEREMKIADKWAAKYMECFAEEKSRYQQLSPYKPRLAVMRGFMPNT